MRRYVCARSGEYKAEGQKRRQMKAQGTKKIGFHCTAQIIKTESDNKIEVEYFDEHYNHDFDVSHLPLAKVDKHYIARKLMMGVEEKRILRDVQDDSVDESGRNQFATAKDIWNVKVQIGASTSGDVAISCDPLSLKLWVDGMKKKGDSTFIYHKEQNMQHDFINSEDFFLVFMLPIQQEMLQKFGGDRICVDSTHGTTGYGFELVTLLVIDEFEEGFPVAFCLTSKVNLKTMMVFFKCIKDSMAITLQTKTFMSDDAPFFYQAWQSVFGQAEKQLLCAWHVDQAWQRNLNLLPSDKRDEMYKILKTLAYELDPEKFTTMMENFVKELQADPRTAKFLAYFCTYYGNRAEQWAYCYRTNAKLNCNNHLEHFHRDLKHIYAKGEKTKRVDNCCRNLVLYVEDKRRARETTKIKGKITKKHSCAFKKHQLARELALPCVHTETNKWQVKSSKSEECYTVEKMHSCTEQCNILCRECGCCLDGFMCSCFDKSIGNNICKHIHAVNLSMEKETYLGPLAAPPTESIDTNGQKQDRSKEELLKLIEILHGKISSKENLDKLVSTQVHNSVKGLIALVDMEISSNDTTSTVAVNEPANKNIVHQRRFFSTQKPRAKKAKRATPSVSEQIHIKSGLLGEAIISMDS